MIKTVEMYTVLCDNCGKDFCDGEEFGAWSEPDFVTDSAEESGWHFEDDKHYCPECFSWDDNDEFVLNGITR